MSNKKRGVNLKKYLGVSIAVGLVGAIWALIAEKLGVPAWITFIGWSIFFFAGADLNACKKSLPCIILGAFLAYVAVFTQVSLGAVGITSAFVVFLLAFIMTISQSISMFSLAPATFIGCANYFATGDLFYSIILTSVGLVLGIITMKISSFLDSIILKEKNINIL